MPDNCATHSKALAADNPVEVTATFREPQGADLESADSNGIPQQIGRYRVERLLGKGGFGLVYLAHDDQLQRLVAIKVPHSALVAQEIHADAYLTEARTVARLDHPHIVPVFDVGGTERFPCFVVSKFVDGTDLATQLKETRLQLNKTAELVATVAEALHHAHKQEVVHRDIKPGNILLDRDGRAYVGDFGLALRDQDLGKGPRYIGTPAYMSPEQARGEGHRVDGRSDIFSLGIVYYELLVGRRPFRADSPQELLEQIARYDPKPPRQIDDTIPKELERICLKALSKRASERYSTARDMAEDLRRYLAELPGFSPSTIAEQQGSDTAAETAVPTPVTVPASDSRPIKIVPKGLRSFDASDADFFLELLPGPRDRDGLPESIRFWKTCVETADPDATFSVGLIYGPSGCGKSSLVKAGLLPRLAKSVIVVYVEATSDGTERQLLKGLRRRLPDLPGDLGLVDALAALRRGMFLQAGQKVLLVLDQFEQWLHARRNREEAELVQALRHCDGGRLQSIVMVRDDFWMATTRFMHELEVNLLEGRNSAAVDLFPIRHAQQILTAFGRALGALPPESNGDSESQRQFIEQAVAALAKDGSVICARLALFAEMLKDKPWAPQTLLEIGGAEGVGVTFLEESFSSAAAPPQHRYHQQAARRVLKALLPDAGTEIKGRMRSYTELLEASGYDGRPRDFDDLIRILDGELRLITPTELAEIPDPGQPAGGKSLAMDARVYQLTHDYLVQPLRDWLTRKQRETRRGRAELRLSERAALWQAKREKRHLPALWELLNAVWFVRKKNRTEIEQQMLRRAGRVHALRWGGALVVTLVLGSQYWNVVATERRNSLQRQVATALDAMQNSRGPAVPLILRDLQRLPRDMVDPALKSRYQNAVPGQKLGLAYALAGYGEVDSSYLVSRIDQLPPEEADNVAAALGQSHAAALAAIDALANQCDADKRWRHKARLAVAALHLADDRLARDMCQIVDRPDPTQRSIFIDEFPTWHGNLAKLTKFCQARTDPALRSGICLGFGAIPQQQLTATEAESVEQALRDCYQTARDRATHSAAGWALRNRNVIASTATASAQPGDDCEWFVNALGMTFVKIDPGEFVRETSDVFTRGTSKESRQYQAVRLTRPFLISDREISVGLFQQFRSDPDYPQTEKPQWEPPILKNRETDDQPVHYVAWYDAVQFCNWLSRKEHRTPCYERTGAKERLQDRFQKMIPGEYDVWRLVENSTGYRLPTTAEWEYACRAGTTTEFACGNDAELLHKYAVFLSGTTGPCGSKLPNGWGLFDMHGNVYEWCHDWVGPYGDGDVIDPMGPAQAMPGGCRVHRGGSSMVASNQSASAWHSGCVPGQRIYSIGFRPVLNVTQTGN